jgi:hypothetical protein
MIDDLVKRLRAVEWSVIGEPCASGNVDETCAKEAAATIEALRAEAEALKLALDVVVNEPNKAKIKRLTAEREALRARVAKADELAEATENACTDKAVLRALAAYRATDTGAA